MSAAFIALGMPALAAYNPSRGGYGARSSGPEPGMDPETAQTLAGLLVLTVLVIMFTAVFRAVNQ